MANSTNAQIGSQTTLSYWGGSPAAYTTLGPIRSISGVGVTKPEVDADTLDSAAVERIGGKPDGKQVTIKFTTASTNHDIIEGFVNGTSAVELRLVIPAPLGKTRYFSIVPLDYDEGDITPSGLLEMTLMGRITGAISGTNPHA